jgi:Cu/Ag efflux pump CusA
MSLAFSLGLDALTLFQLVGQPQLQAVIRPEAISRYGLNVSDVQDVSQVAVGGKAATQVIDGPRRFDVSVRYAPASRLDAERVGAIEVEAPGGQRVALNQLADIRAVTGAAEIGREDGMRRQVVSEIPKPLATVVIGGLLSSTALTLFLLPLIYRWVEGRQPDRPLPVTRPVAHEAAH